MISTVIDITLKHGVELMIIRIHNYELLNFENTRIILSERGISNIKSSKLWTALQEIKELSDIAITEDQLDKIIQNQHLPKEETKTFLEGILKINNRVQPDYFEQALIIVDKSTNSAYTLLSSELAISHKLIFITDFDEHRIKDKKYFIHFHCEEYNYELLQEKYFKAAIAAPQSALSVSYFTKKTFVVSQAYIPEIGSPCHFCGIDRIINYEQNSSSNNNWSKLLNFCKTRKVPIPKVKTTLLQESLAIGLLAQKINFYTKSNDQRRHQDSVFSSSIMKLHNGSVTEEQIPHWPIRQCLRSNT